MGAAHVTDRNWAQILHKRGLKNLAGARGMLFSCHKACGWSRWTTTSTWVMERERVRSVEGETGVEEKVVSLRMLPVWCLTPPETPLACCLSKHKAITRTLTQRWSNTSVKQQWPTQERGVSSHVQGLSQVLRRGSHCCYPLSWLTLSSNHPAVTIIKPFRGITNWSPHALKYAEFRSWGG